MNAPELPEEKLSRGLGEVASADVNTEPDPNTLKEKEDLEKVRYGAQTEGQKQDIQERKKYAQLFFYLSCAWLVAIVVIIMLQGFGAFWKTPFKLSDSIVLAMIGSTTANVLGILYIVAKYLFPNRGSDDNTPELDKSA
jgi:amino acid permease